MRRPQISTLFPYTPLFRSVLVFLEAPEAERHLPSIVSDQFVRLHIPYRSEEHTSELQSRQYIVCRLLLEKMTMRFDGSTSIPISLRMIVISFPIKSLLGPPCGINIFSRRFFNDTATTEIYTLSLHDALPICCIFLVWMRPDRSAASCPAAGTTSGGTRSTGDPSSNAPSSGGSHKSSVRCARRRTRRSSSSKRCPTRCTFCHLRSARHPPPRQGNEGPLVQARATGGPRLCGLGF